jgi:hypothetical protein
VVGHRGVDLASELDEARALAEFSRLPSQVRWLNQDAVAAKFGAAVEGHIAERLGFGRIDDLPDVDAPDSLDAPQLNDRMPIRMLAVPELGIVEDATREKETRDAGANIARLGF